MDELIVLSVLVSYGFFVVLHLGLFRFFKPEEVLNSLMRVGILAGCGHFLFFYLLYENIRIFPVLESGFLSEIFSLAPAAVLSFFILGLLVFVHVLCLFGPYETSIRLRLIRELYHGPSSGMSAEELLQNYNAIFILEKRLRRLIASGELIQQGEIYQIKKNVNIFFFIDFIVRNLQKIIARPSLDKPEPKQARSR